MVVTTLNPPIGTQSPSGDRVRENKIISHTSREESENVAGNRFSDYPEYTYSTVLAAGKEEMREIHRKRITHSAKQRGFHSV